jgi:hypothetical protein
MNLDDNVLYNFTDASSQLLRDDGITPWKGPREKHLLFYHVLIDAFSKSEGIVADLTVATGIKHFVFCFEIIFNVFFTNQNALICCYLNNCLLYV